MKKFIFSFVFLAASASFVSAKVWRLNNNNASGVVADFNNITAAIAGAAAGDTIYVEGSATGYGSVNLQKKLVFIGPGYFLSGAGSNPGLQANPYSAQVYNFNIDSSASGSVFLGLDMAIGSMNNTAGNGADSITINRCHITGFGINFTGGTLAGSVAENWTITQCYIDAGIAVQSMTLNNWNVSNNIINGVNMNNTANGMCIFRNNVVNNLSIYNGYVANNIFDNAGAGITLTASVVKNNLAEGNPGGFASFVGTNGNQAGFTAAQLFQGTTGNSTDGQWRLAAGSPAIGAGLPVGSVTTIDAGAFGGTNPYVLSCIPNIPSIYSLTVPASVPAGQSQNITFSTRSNQ
jgi:hypothetical protein